MSFPLQERRIVITGGSSGIGRALVEQLHDDNVVIVIGRNAEKLDDMQNAFPGVVTETADFTDIGSVERSARAIVAEFPAIDVLINNAAVQHTPGFLDPDFRFESIRREIDVNFTSLCCLTHLMLPAMIKKSPSMVVNVNSGLGLAPKASSAVYCATKGALNLFSRSLGYQLANSNVSVVQAFLPLVDTAMTQGRGSEKITASAAAREIIKGVERKIPEHDIGKVKALRFLLRVAPRLAHHIMKAA